MPSRLASRFSFLNIDFEPATGGKAVDDCAADRESFSRLALQVDDLAVEQYAGVAELPAATQRFEQAGERIVATFARCPQATADGQRIGNGSVQRVALDLRVPPRNIR